MGDRWAVISMECGRISGLWEVGGLREVEGWPLECEWSLEMGWPASFAWIAEDEQKMSQLYELFEELRMLGTTIKTQAQCYSSDQ